MTKNLDSHPTQSNTVVSHELDNLQSKTDSREAHTAGDGWEKALNQSWISFCEANPDDLTSPEDLPDHALMTREQFVAYAVAAIQTKDATDQTYQKLETIVAPDNGTTDEVLKAVLECARAWVPDVRIIGNVRAGDIARVVSGILSTPHTPETAPVSEAGESAWRDVIAERQRQITAEGWTIEHDDKHSDGQLAQAAAAYALHGTRDGTRWCDGSGLFPWDEKWWKLGPQTTKEERIQSRRKRLVKAGALIIAEIERMDRSFTKVKS